MLVKPDITQLLSLGVKRGNTKDHPEVGGKPQGHVKGGKVVGARKGSRERGHPEHDAHVRDMQSMMCTLICRSEIHE